jgi:diaminopimelate epimerase
VSVDMGAAKPGPAVPGPVAEELGERYTTVDLGNPHLVIETAAPDAVELETRGAWLEQQFADGINVEFIAKDSAQPNAIVVRVWERGAGVTRACGTGACAAAYAAERWGLVDGPVTVEMPGGAAEVQLGDPVVLVGPAAFIATIEVPDG